ncbi:MAG TPA: hypothetical protein VFX06_08005 [Stellaceae bacterium]|nr:hypothetical protein [Stellaceae bacterium]
MAKGRLFAFDEPEGEPLDPLQAVAAILGALDAVSCALLVGYLLLWPDQAVSRAIGMSPAGPAALLYAATGLPGLALAYTGRMPRLALALTLAFPIAFMLFYGALSLALLP